MQAQALPTTPSRSQSYHVLRGATPSNAVQHVMLKGNLWSCLELMHYRQHTVCQPHT